MDDRETLIDFLNTQDAARQERKLHRLPLHEYAATDCDYFFTVCARHRGRVFEDPVLARQVCDALLWRRARHRWTLYCYCLMPDHLHFLLRLPEDNRSNADGRLETVLDQVALFKQYTTTQIWWGGGGKGPLWQQSSYDRVLRYGNSVEEAAIYTLSNPVRKGLVQDWKAYPHSVLVDDWRG